MTDETYTLRARRVAAMLPGREIIEDGAVAVRDGLVVEAGTWSEIKQDAAGPVRDLGEITLLPGLVNAHTHLELSHVGLPPFAGKGFLEWVRWLVANPVDALDPFSLLAALDQLAACGTAAVADISSRNGVKVSEALTLADIEHVIQFERFGYFPEAPLPDIARDKLTLAGHALYSTSPDSLQRAKEWDSARGSVFSLHLAEHQGEVELLATGKGDFADFMKERILPKDFAAPGMSPVAWADSLGLLDGKTLAVHAVHVSKRDIDILKSRGATVCLCPRSNTLIGVGRANARAFLDAGVPCCLGTDSLASSPDLNLFGELEALLAYTPLTLVEAVRLLTVNAARLYGFSGASGMQPGGQARFALLPSVLEAALAH